ncbi:MAG: glycoside hydrolase family 47 [Lasallia pustulata]|uniref:alpha-1,2-Mannosidase n=1 Tax=Lasallia pustulata TaxID=136370 RepID=A0A5M8PNR6_9LECA|nr:MAG: glycoside hydrolase family 47 [Lasallia pustulata]
MRSPARRSLYLCTIAACVALTLYELANYRVGYISKSALSEQTAQEPIVPPIPGDQSFRWDKVPQRYPAPSITSLPAGRAVKLPSIQHDFKKDPESPEVRRIREARLEAVKQSFLHAWGGYKKHAWLKDELAPVSGGYKNNFGGWAATLVDTLDTLWIMDLREEFDEAVAAIDKINFSATEQGELNIFETTIRYLGGFLSAYDLSGNSLLLQKAVEVGEMVYVAFDTPNRMPILRWDWSSAASGKPQEAHTDTLAAEIGSLTLEFTRLSQLSNDPKYYDAIHRVMEQFDIHQNRTKLPGMWPVVVDAKDLSFLGNSDFTFGAMSDSLYEYLPKQHMMLGGLDERYRKMYGDAVDVAKQHLLYRPMNKGNQDILLSGNAHVNDDGQIDLDPQGQHLTCFVGGMIGIGAKIFERDELDIARKLVDGCIWAYESMPTGVMSETFHAVPCSTDCQWDEMRWHNGILKYHDDLQGTTAEHQPLPAGFTEVADSRYLLRPEAIESVFILYRITGDTTLQDKAWNMFQAIEKYTRTDVGHAAIDDVTVSNPPPAKFDSMESFWTAETLKYFFLIFSHPDLISLDKYVFNTEAHPLKRPQTRSWWN